MKAGQDKVNLSLHASISEDIMINCPCFPWHLLIFSFLSSYPSSFSSFNCTACKSICNLHQRLIIGLAPGKLPCLLYFKVPI